jgi:hypothetical protein
MIGFEVKPESGKSSKKKKGCFPDVGYGASRFDHSVIITPIRTLTKTDPRATSSDVCTPT